MTTQYHLAFMMIFFFKKNAIFSSGKSRMIAPNNNSSNQKKKKKRPNPRLTKQLSKDSLPPPETQTRDQKKTYSMYIIAVNGCRQPRQTVAPREGSDYRIFVFNLISVGGKNIRGFVINGGFYRIRNLMVCFLEQISLN